MFLVSTVLFSLVLGLSDRLLVKSIRPHIHIIAVDEISASSGDVIRARVHFQNDGDAPIKRLENCEVAAIARYTNDSAEQMNVENGIFESLVDSGICKSIPINDVPAHSISLNSDFKGKSILSAPVMDLVRNGTDAIYIMGFIPYGDKGAEHSSEYCYFTKGDVDGMKLCFVHNTEP